MTVFVSTMVILYLIDTGLALAEDKFLSAFIHFALAAWGLWLLITSTALPAVAKTRIAAAGAMNRSQAMTNPRIYEQKVELPLTVRVFFPCADCGGSGWSNFQSSNPKRCRTCKETGGSYNAAAVTADQYTKGVQEAMARALEAAAKLCETQSKQAYPYECAKAIRNLTGSVK